MEPEHRAAADRRGGDGASVLDLSSRIKLSEPAALAILVELEEHGLVQLSADKGAEHVRIAAITDAGRQEIAGLRL